MREEFFEVFSEEFPLEPFKNPFEYDIPIIE
jgi:hypothetical protein